MKKLITPILFLLVFVIQGFTIYRFLDVDIFGGRTDSSGWSLLSGGNVYTADNVVISTSTTAYNFNISSATTTKSFCNSTATTTGCCDIKKDSDGAGFTYLTWSNGVQTATTTPCQ